MNNITIRQIAAYILKSIKPFPISICVMFLLAITYAVDLSLRPYLLKIILDRLSQCGQDDVFSNLLLPIILYLTSFLFVALGFRLYNYFVEIKMIPNLRAKIANEALQLLLDKNQNFYQNNFSGSLANRVNDLTRSIPEVLRIIIDRFFCNFLALGAAIFTLWQVNIYFALAMMIWTSVLITGTLVYSKKISILSKKWSESGSAITGNLVDTLSNILSIRLFSAKYKEKKYLGEVFNVATLAEQNLEWAYFRMWIGVTIFSIILHSFNFYLLLKGKSEGWISVGDFALVLVINISINDFFWDLTASFSDLSRIWGRITQALKIILDTSESLDDVSAIDLKVTKGIITFDRVLFNYKGNRPLFQDKSVTIEAGQKVGLVGYSGSGKTTFVNLILRLYDIAEGTILIDGQDIRKCSQNSLRRNISMIQQDPSLFHRTLMENIRYGKEDASDEEVIEASKGAYAHDFILKIEGSYGALVGERGVKLSGGQRQRIAIARAILKNAPILILDEATSALDSVIESYIQQSLWQLMQGKTTIVIAHRLSTLLQMDRILVFDQGKIIEDGNHNELINKGGLYKTLWTSQVGGFLLDQNNIV